MRYFPQEEKTNGLKPVRSHLKNQVKMKLFKNILCCMSLLAVGLLASCSQDADPLPVDELEGLKLITSVVKENRTVEFYSVTGKLTTGYNEIFFRVKNPDSSVVANNTRATWISNMKTADSTLSCPASAVLSKAGTSSLFGGFIIFPVAGSGEDQWELTISYNAGGSFSLTGEIPVEAAPKQVVASFEGKDAQKYIIAMVDPAKPEIGDNVMSALLYRMKPASDYEAVSGYKIKIEPWLTTAGRGSSNNTDLTPQDGIYRGNVNLTTTGNWRINLQLANDKGEIIKGEPIGGSGAGSSIYFEIAL